MVNPLPRVLLDTNIIISAILFGGVPRKILRLVVDKKIAAITSEVLLAELNDVLVKKFKFPTNEVSLIIGKLKKTMKLVYPIKSIKVLSDDPDNRVLEAAITGECQIIVTGDKELLALKKYKNVDILSPIKFMVGYPIGDRTSSELTHIYK